MCTIGWASDYHNVPRWVVVLCMYRRCENMRTAAKASHDQQGKQALQERSDEMKALKQWASGHAQEWSTLQTSCEFEWRERQKTHGLLNFGSETFVHVALNPKDQAHWDKQNEKSIVNAVKQAFHRDDHPKYIRPEMPPEFSHRVRIFVDPKEGTVTTLRNTLW